MSFQKDNFLKIWCNYNTEYYSAIKGDELLIHATRVDLKGIMLGEKGQSQKFTPTLRFSIHCSRNVKIIEMDNTLVDSGV